MKGQTAEEWKRYGDEMFEGGREQGQWEAGLRSSRVPWIVYSFALGMILGLLLSLWV